MRVDRRAFPRYRLSAPITVWRADGSLTAAMVIEISEGGLSACFSASLAVGDIAELEPVGGSRVQAIVRRVLGRVHGFEFLDMSAEQLSRVQSQIARLPRFRSGAAGI